MSTPRTTQVHSLTEKTLTDAPLGYNNAEAGAWASGYNSAIEDHATMAEQNQKMRDALERAVAEIHAMRRDDAMKWTNDFDKATAHADSTVSDYREVLASLTT